MTDLSLLLKKAHDLDLVSQPVKENLANYVQLEALKSYITSIQKLMIEQSLPRVFEMDEMLKDKGFSNELCDDVLKRHRDLIIKIKSFAFELGVSIDTGANDGEG